MKRESTPRKQRGAYRPPHVRTLPVAEAQTFLLCTDQYNCVGEVGYDCCAPTSAECNDVC
jgi:hypothetical protein